MMLGIWWVWWALGGTGTVTLGLLAWLAPALLVEIGKAVLGFFITTRLGNVIAAAAIAFFVADTNRSIRDNDAFAVRTAQFEQAQQERDARIAQETRDEVLKQVAATAAASAQTDKEVKEFHDDLPPVPFAATNPFRVGADSCRLRHIVGQDGCGPESPPRVQKARHASKGAGDQSGHRLPGFVERFFGLDRQGQPSSISSK